MKKKLLLMGVICSAVAIAAFAYSKGDRVITSDSCGNCRENGPHAITCGKCDRNFPRVITISEGEEYDVVEYSHKGFSEYDECKHTVTARLYK